MCVLHSVGTSSKLCKRSEYSCSRWSFFTICELWMFNTFFLIYTKCKIMENISIIFLRQPYFLFFENLFYLSYIVIVVINYRLRNQKFFVGAYRQPLSQNFQSYPRIYYTYICTYECVCVFGYTSFSISHKIHKILINRKVYPLVLCIFILQ